MQEKLSHKEIMIVLKNDKTFLRKEFGVINIGLFGSYAKGNQKADSDIDFLVELKEPRFEWLAGLQIYLETKFGRKIELIRKGKNINQRLIQKVERDIMRDTIIQLIMENLRIIPRDRPIHLIVHRDGDVYPDEEQGLEEAISSLRQRKLEVSLTLVSIRESTPYRIFKCDDSNLAPCPPGVFVKLSNRKKGLLSAFLKIFRLCSTKKLFFRSEISSSFS